MEVDLMQQTVQIPQNLYDAVRRDFTEKTAEDTEVAEIYQKKSSQIRAIRGFFQQAHTWLSIKDR
ncbi:MAG TPA: hypothetical protein ENK32_09865 [Anaerolineae bacterium]|nr:hypothetical protein [Anaerolineae bacterium]